MQQSEPYCCFPACRHIGFGGRRPALMGRKKDRLYLLNLTSHEVSKKSARRAASSSIFERILLERLSNGSISKDGRFARRSIDQMPITLPSSSTTGEIHPALR